MKEWIKEFSKILLIFSCFWGNAQDVPIGAWRNHFSYGSAQLLASGDQKIFCAAENGIFYVDLTDKTLTKLSKQQGLSDVAPTSIAYDEEFHMLLIGYASGLIDIVSADEVRTLREVNETGLAGEKPINGITTYQGMAYFATGFGVIVVSLESGEIVENYRFIGYAGQEVTGIDLEIFNDHLFLITEDGIQSGLLQDNLQDFNNWIRYDETYEKDYHGLGLSGNDVFSIESGSRLVQLTDGVWSEPEIAPFEHTLVDLLVNGDQLFIMTNHAIYSYDSEQLILHQEFIQARNANQFLYENGFWMADGKVGLLDPSGEAIHPNGPLTDQIMRVRFEAGQLFAFFGPGPAAYSGEPDSLGYSYFDNTSWNTSVIPGFYNLTDVAQYNNQLFFASAGYGLYNQSTSFVMDHTNSALTNSKSAQGVIIPELSASDVLYVLSYNSEEPLYTLNEQGISASYSEDYLTSDKPTAIDVSQGETLWLTTVEQGLLALELTENLYRRINTADNLPSNAINDVLIDLNDEAWIATADGPAVFPDATFVFDAFDATEPIYENRKLFEEEPVTALGVDGGNRLWMATSNGVFVFNNTLSAQVASFNVSNSPLPSNEVRQFCYNPLNGEMFILTNKGLVSYRSGSSAAGDHSAVNIFPNPVRPGYNGLVGISGVVQNATVKITDIHGKLIRELAASGSTASWDLLDYNSRRVSAGIYVIFSSSADGMDTFIGKIAVVN